MKTYAYLMMMASLSLAGLNAATLLDTQNVNWGVTGFNSTANNGAGTGANVTSANQVVTFSDGSSITLQFTENVATGSIQTTTGASYGLQNNTGTGTTPGTPSTGSVEVIALNLVGPPQTVDLTFGFFNVNTPNEGFQNITAADTTTIDTNAHTWDGTTLLANTAGTPSSATRATFLYEDIAVGDIFEWESFGFNGVMNLQTTRVDQIQLQLYEEMIVPEPSAAGMVFLGMLAMLNRRRRK